MSFGSLVRAGTLAFLVLAAPDAARSVEEPAGADPATIAQLEATLTFERGKVTLGKNIATLNVPSGYRYLNPKQAAMILSDVWGNPPQETLGMLFANDVSPFTPDTWGVVISFDEDGFVKDEDAETLDYSEILATMKSDAKDANAQRTKAGYPPVEIIGWAEPPHYDKQQNKLYWAKELAFGDESSHTLNYDIRALGRRGVLVMSAVASMDRLAAVKTDMKEVLAAVSFNDGHRYADFDPKIDKVAAYGIGALVAGKVAAKAGLLKGLIALLLAGKKLIVVAVIALVAILKRIATGRAGEIDSSALSGTSER